MDYDVDYNGLGQRIRLFRKEKGMTQDDLAEKAQVSRDHISHLETGTNIPSLALVVRLANILEVSADDFLSDSLDVFTEGVRTDLLAVLEGCSSAKTELLLRCLESIRNVMSDLGFL